MPRLVLDGRIMLPRMTGAARYVFELARRLPGMANGLAVEVILLPAMRLTSVAGVLADAGVRIHFVDVRVASLRQWIVMPLVVRRLLPDLYHYPFVDLPLVSVPSVVTIYDLNPILHREYFDRLAGLKRVVARRMIASTLRRSRAALAISNATRILVQQHFPAFAHKVQTIPLGVDLAGWTGDSPRDLNGVSAPVASEAPWSSRPYLLYVGVDRPHKNLLRLVGAFGQFRTASGLSSGYGPYLWLAGVGRGSRALRERVSALALGGDVRFGAVVDESGLSAVYRGAAAVAYVSTSEGFGLPILEAFAAGVPVMAAEASSLPEVGGSAALYVNPYDEQAMCERLIQIWSDAGLRRTLVERGHRRAQSFTWDSTASATLAAYDRALRGTPVRGTSGPIDPT